MTARNVGMTLNIIYIDRSNKFETVGSANNVTANIICSYGHQIISDTGHVIGYQQKMFKEIAVAILI